MVVGELLVLPLGPVVEEREGDQSWTSVPRKLEQLGVDLRIAVLEHGRDDLLLEGREHLHHLPVHVSVLLPQLLQRWSNVVSLFRKAHN